MKPSFVVALVGLALAVVDFSGAARWVEAQVRPAMHWLLRKGKWLLDKGSDYSTWGAVFLLGVAAVLAALQSSGFDLGPLKLRWSTSEEAASPDWTNILLFAPVWLGGLMLASYGVLWVLAWPKRGVVSSLGLAIAAVGVVLELLL
jgi:hypothetical protein